MSHRCPPVLGSAALFCPALILLAVALWPASAPAQLPATRLASVFPAGANPGQTLEVLLAGTDLDGVDRLSFSHPGITAQQQMAEPGPFDSGPQPAGNRFVVTVAGNVPVGRYEVRAAGKYGMSNPRAFMVGDVPELPEAEPNDSPAQAAEIQLPVVVNGRCDRAADVDCFQCTASASQRVVVSCRARRIDSLMDAVVVVYDAAGREVGSSRDGHAGDPLVDFTAAANGKYTIKVYESLHRGGDSCFYRLAVGALPHIDYVFPPAAAAGGNRPVTIFGRNLPGGQPSGVSVHGQPLQKLNVAVPIPGGTAAQTIAYDSLLDPPCGGIDATQYRLKGPLGWSNPVLVGVATAPAVVEREPNNDPEAGQVVTVPCEVMGQFYPQRDDDWYQFEAKQNEALTVEVISHRMGLPTDTSLLIQQVVPPAAADRPPNIKQIALVNDSGNTEAGPEFDVRTGDPEHRFTAPADGTYRVLVRDGRNALAADPRQVYRLAIRRNQPDFRLVAVPEGSSSAVLLRKGGQVAIRTVAFRRDGFDGEIKVSATNLPSGVTCHDAVIGPTRNAAALVLAAAATAAPLHGPIQIVGTAQIGGATLTRPARFGAAIHPKPPARGNRQMPAEGRLTRDLVISVSPEAAPLTLQAGGGKVWETSRAGIVKIPYVRVGPFTGKISLTPQDLPANITAAALAINPNVNSGEYEIKLKNNTPPGTYTFYLSGVAEKVKYARNPEAAAAAAERKKQVDQIHAETTAAAKVASDAKTAADKAATEAGTAAQTALAAKQAVDQTLAQAQAATMATADKAAQTKATAAKDPGNAALATAATDAERLAAEAVAEAQAATTKVAAAQTALDQANAGAQAATDTQTETDKKAAEAAARLRAATELKARIDKLATDTAAAAQPKDLNVPVVSTPITLKITPAPITLSVSQPATPVKQGEKIEATVTVQRLYAYNGAVTISTAAPSGVAGVSIPNATIAAGQTQTKLTVTAAANATVGQHEFTARATLTLNGQSLTVEQPVTLNVQPAPVAN